MTTTRRVLATQIACAFSEEFFGFADGAGRTMVPVDQAAVFATGRLDLWSDWPRQSVRTQELMGRFLRMRPSELGSPRRFRDAVTNFRADGPYQLSDEVAASSSTSAGQLPVPVPAVGGSHVVYARHGQSPLDLAERLLDEADAQERNRRLLPVAGPGRWSFGWPDTSVVELPDIVRGAAPRPVEIATSARMDTIDVDPADLKALAVHLARVTGRSPWEADKIEELFAGLRDAQDDPVTILKLNAGRLQLLNAPTGVGKSVLTRLLATHLARRGIPVAIVVGTIRDALTATESIAEHEDAEATKQLAGDIQDDLAALGTPVRCHALVSPRRLHDQALLAAQRDEWARFDRVGYGCHLLPLIVDGPPPTPADEPCTALRPADDPTEADDTSKDGGRSKETARHACPWVGSCERHRGFHDAAAADVIVTNHHNLTLGTVGVPVRIDGVDHPRTTVLELLLRRCPVVLVDEIDLLQSNMFDAGARHLPLSSNTARHDLLLGQIETQRSRLSPTEDRDIAPALSRTKFLAEQFLNYVLGRDIWLESDPDRPGSGWHVPGADDRKLLTTLFGVDPADGPVDPALYAQFNALFPDTRDLHDGKPPKTMRNVAALLRSVVDNNDGRDRISEIKHDLHDALRRQVPDTTKRRDVINTLLVRTWLGSLHQSLTRLSYAVGSPAAELPAARALGEQLGTFPQHAAIPYGPLGYLLFGFRVDQLPGPDPRGTLSVQAIGGDPHTTVAQLGGTVALATAGVPRIVMGLSATAYFPGAAREHIRSEVTYAMTDAVPGAFTTYAGTALDDQFQAIHIGGRSESEKPSAIHDLGATLWDQHLDAHLRHLAETEPDRERCLLVGNSYTHAALLGAGIASRVPDPRWIAVVVPKDRNTGRRRAPGSIVLPAGTVEVTSDDIEALPRTHPSVKVCIAPLSVVARGLNILVPDAQRSALASVWVCVRPPTALTEPAEMFASVNAYALDVGEPGPDPAALWAEQSQAAFRRMYHILGSDPRFSRLSRVLKAEAVAGMLIDLIQLGGRARRGGTPVDLFLVDGAFHDPKLGSDLPSLLRFYYGNLDHDQQQALRRIYGSTLTSWLDFANVAPTS